MAGFSSSKPLCTAGAALALVWFVGAPARSGPAAPGSVPGNAATAAVPATSAPTPAPTSAAPAADTEPEGRRTALVASLTVKVANPVETRNALEQRARELGGFPTFVADRELRLKVPPARLSTLLDAAAEHGLVIEKSLERADLTLEIAKLESQLKSKRAILAELRGFFDGSDVAATLQIEQSMTELVNELESVKGQLRVLHDRADWAVVRVSFEFKERQRINTVSSPFEWLNSVNLPRFLSEF